MPCGPRTRLRERRCARTVIRDASAREWVIVMRLALGLVTGLLGATLLAGGDGTDASAATGYTRTVTLRDIAFHPAKLSIRRGTKVRWRWLDEATPHTVTSRGKRRFRSARARVEGTHVVRFTKRGTYSYHCTIHPGMSGRIVVR